MFGPHLGCDRDAAWFPGISRQFRGHGVQAMSRMLKGHILIFTYFYAFSWTWCAGNVRDASGLLQGCSLISKHLWAILFSFWVTVCRSCQGRFRATAGTKLDFQVISGSFWGRCIGHVQDASWPEMQPDFQAFLGNFWDLVCRPSPGRVMATAETHSNFQAFLGRFWVIGFSVWGICRQFVGTTYRPCPGRVLAATGTQPDFHAFLGKFWDSVCSPCPGRIMATAGTKLDFKAILGSLWDTVCRPCPGYDRDAISGTRCASHVQNAVGTHPDFHVFLHNNLDTIYRQCSGRVEATAWMQPDFQAFVGSFWDTVCRPCPGHVMDTVRRQWVFKIKYRSYRTLQAVCGHGMQGHKHIPKHSGQFLGHGVMPYSGKVIATTGTQPHFQAFFDSFWALCSGHVRDIA
ncbi:Hypothetical predicted protein [Olea europaea subsp. europaea]|uniref:Uncharacterized protein n=1 Tax=Olea europaea subsp. europaea TaxID=158383 RepID=A0A8S0PMC3_OLEEU|nr:Hypothetical predicted protein [Olea europaea subsp. europaea]